MRQYVLEMGFKIAAIQLSFKLVKSNDYFQHSFTNFGNQIDV